MKGVLFRELTQCGDRVVNTPRCHPGLLSFPAGNRDGPARRARGLRGTAGSQPQLPCESKSPRGPLEVPRHLSERRTSVRAGPDHRRAQVRGQGQRPPAVVVGLGLEPGSRPWSAHRSRRRGAHPVCHGGWPYPSTGTDSLMSPLLRALSWPHSSPVRGPAGRWWRLSPHSQARTQARGSSLHSQLGGSEPDLISERQGLQVSSGPWEWTPGTLGPPASRLTFRATRS